VEPTITASDLREAVERFWWPAILEEFFTVDIYDWDKTQLVPSPRRNPDLTAFIHAYDFLGTGNSEGSEGTLRLRRFTFNKLNLEGVEYDIGDLVLAADPASWTFPATGNDDDPAPNDGDERSEVPSHRSLVALTRGPRMVVEYSERGQAAPFV